MNRTPRTLTRLLAVAGVAAALSSAVSAATTVAHAAGAASTIAATEVNAYGSDYSVALPVSGEGTRWYRLFVPNNLRAGPRPLIVAIHYFSGSATSMESLTGFDSGAAANGVVVAYRKVLATRSTAVPAAARRATPA